MNADPHRAAPDPRGGAPAASSRRWARIALWLVAGTLAYNVVEAVVAIWAGERAESIALVGFGLDSVIECAAAAVLLWRLGMQQRAESSGRSMTPAALEAVDRKVHGFVGVTFFLLAAYVLAQAALTLWRREPPEASTIGIILSSASLVIMPLLSWGKLKAATRIGSAALRSEAKETMACSYLSLTLLLGLAANAALGWWWADPVAALIMIPWLVKEGTEGIRGGCHDGCDD